MTSRLLISITLATLLFSADMGLSSAASPKPGDSCSKLRKTQTIQGETYVCIKKGKKQIWSKNSKVAKPRLSAAPSATPQLTPTPSPAQKPEGTLAPIQTATLKDSPELIDLSLDPDFCKLQDLTSDSRRNYSSVGFPMNQDRLKPTGSIEAIFIGVDFSDLPSKETLRAQLDPFAQSAESFFEFMSDNKLNWINEYFNEMVRLDKPSSEYKIDREKVDFGKTDYLPIRRELITKVESKGIDLSKYDVVAFVPPRYTRVGGPAFLDSATTSIRGKNGPILNSVFFAWFFPPEYMVAHEIGHLFGLNHIDDLKSASQRTLSTSGWDVMANDGSVMSYFGWHKWLIGWVSDSQVTCLNSIPRIPVNLRIDHVDASSASRKLMVIRQSANRAIVIETRRANRFDVPMPTRTSVVRTSEDFGVIAYLVDTSKGWEEGTINILGDPPKNGWGQKIGIKRGQSLEFDGVKVSVVETDQSGDWIEIRSTQ